LELLAAALLLLVMLSFILRIVLEPTSVTTSSIDLQSKVIGDDGFFVICSKEEGDLQGKCDEIVGEDTPADNDGERRLNVGDGSVALVRDDQLIDSFSGNLDSFSRAARDKSSSLASSAWQPEAWIDDKGQTFSKDASFSNEIVKEMFTIRGWAETPLSFYISELCDPIDGKENRFIELYSPNKRDYIMNE
jgi:hypothetical protein